VTVYDYGRTPDGQLYYAIRLGAQSDRREEGPGQTGGVRLACAQRVHRVRSLDAIDPPDSDKRDPPGRRGRLDGPEPIDPEAK
jgi:hypothetical protein